MFIPSSQSCEPILSHTGRSVEGQAGPDHLLSVVADGHAPAAACAGPKGRAAPSVRRSPEEPGEGASGVHQCVRAPGGAAELIGFLSCAPGGTTPCATKRHSAITSRRATATTPMRRLRPPARLKRFRKPHRERTVRLPPEPTPRELDADAAQLGRGSALLIPWSCTRWSLRYGTGTNPVSAPGCRGFRNVRVANNSALNRLALVSPTPRNRHRCWATPRKAPLGRR